MDSDGVCRGGLTRLVDGDAVGPGMGAPPAPQFSGFASGCSPQPRFDERLWRKTGRSYFDWAREGTSQGVGGTTGPGVGLADAVDGRQSSHSQMSSVAPNPEDDGEDFDAPSVALKRPETENNRRNHLRSSELRARLPPVWGVDVEEGGSDGGRRNWWGVGGESAVARSGSSTHDDDAESAAHPMGPSLEGYRGNTALQFSNKDLEVVRAIALALMEEDEKKRRQEMRGG
ncbi:uncharacterized protein Tco025E_04718 [Trypanosoma conorhini]|uniref:Uncharacterized protein n=1 Tax=Trypanosoma conorhini TaxID=83891 RepID=A0A422PK42_9TRYP|nr:uncharacterized protein Tco025E_04718 [Trypanosoma conorhini]RNF18080.1 hypothetical protein Tco025E_04718 [Trypanosoma conorhini]